MRKIILFFAVFLFLTSIVSAVEMRRTNTFETGEEVFYDFLEREYVLRVIHIQTGAEKATLEINGHRKEVNSQYPLVFDDLKVVIKEIVSPYEITLNMSWEKDDVEPDKRIYATMNQRETLTINGKQFEIILTEIDDIKRKVKFKINEEEITIGESEKATLKDESIIKTGAISGSSIRSIPISIWASDVEIEAKEEITYDAEERLAENEQKTLEIKGTLFDIVVEQITDERKVEVHVDDEIAMVSEDEEATLESNITVRVTQVSLKAPRNVLVQINIPEYLVNEEFNSILIDRTLGINQKDEFESEGKKIITRIISLNEENETVNLTINGNAFEMGINQVEEVDGVQFTVKRLNIYSHPAKVILTFLVPKKAKKIILKPTPEPKEVPEEIEEELEEFEETLEEVEEDLSEQEIPEPTLPEEEEEEETKVLTIGESVKWTWNWFLGLFS